MAFDWISASAGMTKQLRTMVMIAAALISTVTLAGCGFRPLYGTGPGAAGDALAGIEVPPLPNREGQLVHDYLTRALAVDGNGGPSRYRLDIQLSSSRAELGIRQDETATRANLTMSASMSLVDLATNKVIYTGATSVTNSYNIVEAQFATVASEIDSTERAARALADNIRTRVAAFLASREREG